MREEGREPGKNRASSWRKNTTGTHYETRVTSDVGPLWVLQEILWIDIKYEKYINIKKIFFSNSKFIFLLKAYSKALDQTA